MAIVRCVEECSEGSKDCTECRGLGQVSVNVLFLQRPTSPDDGRRDVMCEASGCSEGKVRCPCECNAGFYDEDEPARSAPHSLPGVL